jgi:hypothetical protein
MKNLVQLFTLFVFLTFCGCKKEQIIGGNEPPPDPTVANILVENYIRNCFLNLVGRVPTQPEFDATIVLLKKNNISTVDRAIFLDKLMATLEYRKWHFSQENLLLCAGKADDQGYIDYYRTKFTDDLANPDYAIQKNELERELLRINLLDDAKEAWLNGTISVTELQKRIADNRIFKFENNISDDFMEAWAGFFLLREPTENEQEQFNLANATFETLFFGKSVNSLDELKTVFFDSGEYYEGQIRWLFRSYLFREPTGEEIQKLLPNWQGGKDYQALQRAILSSNDFLGI